MSDVLDRLERLSAAAQASGTYDDYSALLAAIAPEIPWLLCAAREAEAWREHKSISAISLLDAPIRRAMEATDLARRNLEPRT